MLSKLHTWIRTHKLLAVVAVTVFILAIIFLVGAAVEAPAPADNGYGL